MQENELLATKSLKINVILNTFKNIISVIVPLGSFIYVSRIIGPEGIGKVVFAQSFVNYFLIFAVIGIPVYGVREISKVRNNHLLLQQRFNEIFFINTLFTLIAFLAFVLMLFYNPEIAKNKIILLYSLNLFFLLFSVEWFYQGLEDYFFITIRSIIIEVLTFTFIYIFVKNHEDYFSFALILVVMKGVYGIINLSRAQKLVPISFFKKHNLKRHIKPLLYISGICIVDNIYQNIDIIMLGYMYGNKEVGWFSTVIQIIKTCTFLIISLSIVLIPRLSFYIENGLMSDFNYALSKSIDLLMFFSIPAVVGMICLSDSIILIFAGTTFSQSILTLKIMSPLIFINSLYIVIGYNVLVPLGKEKLVFLCLCGGVIINVICNIILIEKYGHNGAALASLITHFSILIMFTTVSKNIILPLLLRVKYIPYILSSILISLIIFAIKFLIDNIYLELAFSVISAASIYISILLAFKNELVTENLLLIKEITKPKKN